jgi:hypothetical protein
MMLIIDPVLSVEHREGSRPHHKHRKHAKGDNVCLTPQCVQLSADILRSLGDSDPCDDFYDCPFPPSHDLRCSVD